MHCFDKRQRTPPTQTANATHTDCERRPIRLRTLPTQIANATTKVDVLFDKS